MTPQDYFEHILKETYPIDLIPEDQRNTIKRISSTLGDLSMIKLIKSTTDLNEREAEIYYKLYIKG